RLANRALKKMLKKSKNTDYHDVEN
ncbi:hypothetical protein LCGC14_2133680, partial [marine sediment metagenome]